MSREVRYLPRPAVIRDYMEGARFTHRDLADRSRGAFKKSTVGNLLNPKAGQGVSREVALALADIFRCDVETFFVREVRKMESQIPQKVV